MTLLMDSRWLYSPVCRSVGLFQAFTASGRTNEENGSLFKPSVRSHNFVLSESLLLLPVVPLEKGVGRSVGWVVGCLVIERIIELD
jgi:hypothetical protein